MERLTAKKIMSNVNGKIFDESRIVDSVYLDPELKAFASAYGKSNQLSLTYILARIVEFAVANKDQLNIDRNKLVDRLSVDGVRTTIRVKRDVYKDFGEYTKSLKSCNSAFLNMVLSKIYDDDDIQPEFNTAYLEKLLLN
ncbi:hypothetical protein MOW14_14985 (plasmid) [Acinetobacter indicus]|uniref:hypothetical protein n=1 Tax=Acinetobacter indicus TaxID=756892 RepID=UPI001FA7FA68|nr:hypothetical protein [Acinetobacter indicus]UNW11133.1 hypothetical protein MOW14_14985 [Acinetobacter indicus]